MAQDLGEPLSVDDLCPRELLDGWEAAFMRDVKRLNAATDRIVDVDCPACDGTGHEPAFEKYGFRYVRCNDCRTLFMTPRPSESLMAEYYASSENYGFWSEHIFPATDVARREKIHRGRLERVLELCDRNKVPTGTLLEVGAGYGTFGSLALESKRFSRIIAVEPTPEMAEACRAAGLDVIENRIEDIPEGTIAADVVVSLEIIEHLFEPKVFVARCAKLLKPGGLIILSCPNGDGFDIATLGPGSQAIDVEHVNLFNPGSLKSLLQDNGFSDISVSTPGRLDAEIVREAALAGGIDLSGQPFLRRVLIDEWDDLGWPFQKFLADTGLSSHMWVTARRVID
jgi:2-polyprenyl-6-hydroxyphenyl methylase/3-demethylubiquinone-9 3-methyltransferase